MLQGKSRGQTLIESLVALTVLTIGLMGAVSLGIYTVRAAETSQTDIIAMNLAQEGIEGIRWIRDSNWKQDKYWGEGFNKEEPGINYRGRMEVNLPDEEPAFDYVERTGGHSLSFYKLCYQSRTGRYLHAPEGVSCQAVGYEETEFDREVLTYKGDYSSISVYSFIRYRGEVKHILTEKMYDWW